MANRSHFATRHGMESRVRSIESGYSIYFGSASVYSMTTGLVTRTFIYLSYGPVCLPETCFIWTNLASNVVSIQIIEINTLSLCSLRAHEQFGYYQTAKHPKGHMFRFRYHQYNVGFHCRVVVLSRSAWSPRPPSLFGVPSQGTPPRCRVVAVSLP